MRLSKDRNSGSLLSRKFSLALVVLWVAGCAAHVEPSTVQSWTCTPCVVAHRGDHTTAPENSIAGIQSALQGGIELVEIDVRLTRDGIPFLFHDRKFRLGNIIEPSEFFERPLSSFTAEELSRVKLSDGAALPRLSQLAKVQDASILFDLKASLHLLEPHLRRLVQAKSTASRYFILCYTKGDILRVKENLPGFEILARVGDDLALDDALALHPPIVQIDLDAATGASVDRIHAAGAQVLVKVLGPLRDNANTWMSLRRRGIDFMLTDHPREMQRWKKNINGTTRETSLSHFAALVSDGMLPSASPR